MFEKLSSVNGGNRGLLEKIVVHLSSNGTHVRRKLHELPLGLTTNTGTDAAMNFELMGVSRTEKSPLKKVP